MSTTISSSSSSNNSDEMNDLQAAHNWLKCLTDLFNQFVTEAESRSNDSAAKRLAPEIRADYLLQVDSLEQQINNMDPLTFRNLLSANGTCLRLRSFSDPLLQQKCLENETAIEQLRDQASKIDALKRDHKWMQSVHELVAANIFAWGAHAIVEILEYDKTSDELVRLSDDDLNFLIKVINCLKSWKMYRGGYQIDKCQKICEVLVKVINNCYWPSAKSGDGHMSALENELAECAVKILDNLMTQWQAQDYPKHATTLINLFLDSLSGITKAECKEGNKNEAIAVSIYSLISSACEKQFELMVSGIRMVNPESAELYKRVVAQILEGTTKPGAYPVDESSSEVVLRFWLILAYKIHEDVEWEEQQECIEQIKPLYAQLTHIVLKKAQYPDENFAKRWTEDDLLKLDRYRSQMEGALCAFYDVLQYNMLEILSCLLDEGIAEMQTNPMFWTKLEVCIFAFSSIAGYVAETDPPIETGEVPKLMRTLIEIPYDVLDERIFKMALKAVDSHRYWFIQNPEYISNAVQILVKALNSPLASEACLSDLCSECQELLKPYAEPLLDACNDSILSGRITGLDAVYLTMDIGKLISVLPDEKMKKYLGLIINPYFEELQTICKAGERDLTSKGTTVFRLKLISSLFESLDINVRNYGCEEEVDITVQPVLTLCQKKMPLFREMAEFWKDDDDVIEAICNTLRSALTNLDKDFKPMLEEFCSFLISIYQRKPCQTVLYVSSECLRIFGLDEDTKPLRQQILSQIVFYTFKLFEETPEDEFSKIIEMVEKFRYWMMDLIKSRFELLSEINVDYTKLISYVLKVLAETERGFLGCTTRFLEIFILHSRNLPKMTQAVLDHGELIVRTALLTAACHETRKDDVERFADVLEALNNNYLAELTDWLKMVDAPNFPTPLISAEDKKKFVAQVIKPDSNKYHIRMHVREFAANCRGVEQI